MESSSNDNKKVFQCSYCKKNLSSKRVLEHHEYNVCRYKTYHKCPKCRRYFYSQGYLERHQKICLGLKCINCDKEFSSKQMLKTHILNMCYLDSVFECDICSKSFSSRNYLKRHKKVCISLKCPICNKVLSTKQTFNNHYTKCKKKNENKVVSV